MPKPYRLSATDTAILTIYLLKTFSEDKGRKATRARISQATLRRLADRIRLRNAFVEEWMDELAAFGWSAFPVGDNFAIIDTEATDGWPRIASNRIRTELKKIHDGDVDEFERISEEIMEENPDEEGSED